MTYTCRQVNCPVPEDDQQGSKKVLNLMRIRTVPLIIVETWFAFIDMVVQQIDDRFAQDCFRHIANVENLLLKAANGLLVTSELGPPVDKILQ